MHPRLETRTAMWAGKPFVVATQWHPFGWPRPAWAATHRVCARPLDGEPVEFEAMAWDVLESHWDSFARWGLYPAEEWALDLPMAPFWVDCSRDKVDGVWRYTPIGPRHRHRSTLDGLPGVLEVTNLATGNVLRSELTAAGFDERAAQEAAAAVAKVAADRQAALEAAKRAQAYLDGQALRDVAALTCSRGRRRGL